MIAGAFLRKEIAELARDRRVLLLSIVLPVIINPAMFAITTVLERREETRLAERVLSVAVTGGERARPFVEAAREDSTLRVVETGEPDALRADVKRGALEAWLDVGPGDSGELGVRLVSHAPRAASTEAASRLRRSIERAEVRAIEERWRAAGGEGSLRGGAGVRSIDVASSEESRGADAGRRIPLLLVLTVFVAGSALAADVVAGEKERGTLETLYLTPARRGDIALAKYGVVVAATLLAGLLNVSSMFLATKLGLVGEAAGGAGLSAGGIATACVLLVPLAALAGGVLLGLSAFARSIKEYQVLVTPVMLLALIPGLLAMTQDVPLTPWTALLPVANVALAVRDGLLGPLSFPLFAIVTLASAGWGLLAMRWVGEILSREETILGFDPEPLLARTPSGRRRAVFLGMALTVLVYFYLGQLLQGWRLRAGLLLSLWVLLPALAAAVARVSWSGGRVAEVLSWRAPHPAALAGGLLLGLGTTIPMASGFVKLQNAFLPSPEGLLKPIEDLAAGGAFQVLFLLAISPAICEELAFRGVFLGLLRRVVPLRRAVISSALFFGLIHLSIFRFLPTTLLGIALALLVVRSGSIFPAMAFHLGYNGLAVLAERFLPESWIEGSAAGFGASAACLVAGAILVRASPSRFVSGRTSSPR